MWGQSSNYPSISSYEDAKRTYENTKPVRGHPDFRPLVRRSIDCPSQIIKQDDQYVIKLYRTDLVTYFPDGSVFVSTGGWSTPSTRAAISAMSPFSAWSSKGDTAVAVRSGSYMRSQQAFFLPGAGLLFKPDAEGALVPVNPPTAVLRKTRVKREEAKAARKFFKPVETYIKAYSRAFAGGEAGMKPRIGTLRDVFASGVLSDETASDIARAYLAAGWNFVTGRQIYTGDAKAGCTGFWRAVYAKLSLTEDYEVPLPYGTVA